MPALQRLVAKRGVSFTNCLCSTPLCGPSRASILRGQYVHNHGIYTNKPPTGGYAKFVDTGLEASTLGTALQGAGYRTVYIGKYLNGYPLADAVTHVPPGWEDWVSPAIGYAYGAYDYTLNVNGVLVPHGSAPEDYITDVLAGYATASIMAASQGGAPFFLHLATYAPHQPATSAPRHVGMFADLALPRTPSFNEVDVSDKHADVANLNPVRPSGIARIDGLYRQRLRAMQAVDEMIAGIVEALELTGQMQNTYLVFASDNGFHMGQHRLKEGKGTPYEEDIVVPLIVRGPGVPEGQTVDALTTLTDLMPTFLELAGVPVPEFVDGRSLVPYLVGQPPARWRDVMLLEYFPYSPAQTTVTGHSAEKSGAAPTPNGEVLPTYDAPHYMALPTDGQAPTPAFIGLRGNGFKYVEFRSGEREQYDLERDPYELDSCHSAASPATTMAFHRWLSALASCTSQDCASLEDGPPVLPWSWLPVVGR